MADAGDEIAQLLLNNKEKLWRMILWSYRKIKEKPPLPDFDIEHFKDVESASLRAEALEQVLGKEGGSQGGLCYVIGSDRAG